MIGISEYFEKKDFFFLRFKILTLFWNLYAISEAKVAYLVSLKTNTLLKVDISVKCNVYCANFHKRLWQASSLEGGGCKFIYAVPRPYDRHTLCGWQAQGGSWTFIRKPIYFKTNLLFGCNTVKLCKKYQIFFFLGEIRPLKAMTAMPYQRSDSMCMQTLNLFVHIVGMDC